MSSFTNRVITKIFNNYTVKLPQERWRLMLKKFTLILFFFKIRKHLGEGTSEIQNKIKGKKKKFVKHRHCKQAKLAQHNRNCTDNLKQFWHGLVRKGTTWQMHIGRNVQQGAYTNREILTILSCVKCPVIHSLLLNSAGWGKEKNKSYT